MDHAKQFGHDEEVASHKHETWVISRQRFTLSSQVPTCKHFKKLC